MNRKSAWIAGTVLAATLLSAQVSLAATSANSAAGESFTNRISGTPRMITRSGDQCHLSCEQFSCAQ